MTRSERNEMLQALQILGLSEGASDDEIKRVYRELASKWHPDRVSDNLKKEAEEKFKNISLAYELLTDKGKHIDYQDYCNECRKKVILFTFTGFNNSIFCSFECKKKYEIRKKTGLVRHCWNCSNIHKEVVPLKCEKITSAISELELLSHWFFFKTDEKEKFIQEIKDAKLFFEEKEFDNYIKKILKQAEELNKKKKDLLASERSKYIQNLENLDSWKLLDKNTQNSFKEEVKGCNEDSQFNNILERIEKTINKQLNNLIARGQQANSYEKLEPIIKEIKKYSFTIAYLGKKEEIKSLEEKFTLFRPQKFDEKFFQDQLRKNEISWNDLDQETKNEIEAIKKNNTSDKGQKLEEKINEKGAEIRLNKLIICARKATTEVEKKEMLRKLIEFINKTTYQSNSYHKLESEVEVIINELNGKVQFGQQSLEPFPYQKIFLLFIPLVIILILFFLTRKKKRKIR